MLTLGIETATAVCSVALVREGRMIAEYRHQQAKMHAEIIAQLIENQMNACGLSFAELEGIGISTGPGSYTGLRIGMSFAKSLAFAHDLPIAAIPTCEAMAFALPADIESIAIVLPSRRGEVYAALYQRERDRLKMQKPATALEIQKFAEWVADCRKIAGPGSIALAQAGLSEFQILPERMWQLSALNVALLAENKLMAGMADNLDTLEPDYLKPFFTTAKIVQPDTDAT